eukprot:CAMPEP_0181052748 /NCGR_PEP_ID=MMETSP1070-20121207/17753_1 /TAXON_ID=265543 /ORGANISM="Minutocellus polymorphus, Strain NH13" /LENGTH=249 /DNA_ID=CAMNT_0023131857 /DNA_START=128 /DNA_END=877 /DNA_ORIENTATION=-
MRSKAKVPSSSSALVGVLVGVITVSSIVHGFTPLPSPPPSSQVTSSIAVSLYIDPIDATKPASSTPASQQNQNSVPSPKSSGSSSSGSARSVDSVRPKSASPSRRRRRQQPAPTHTIAVESPAEFDAQVRSEADKLVVVRFHSPYCPACKSISVSYDKLVKTSSSEVKFVDVTVMDRNDLIPYGLDVPATPYGQIWYPGAGLVEQSAIPRRQFSKFKKILKWYAKGECELPEEFFSNPHNEYDLENLIL